ncbi:hypothetical protein PR202_ga12011 [Eleusine coracana subsp. coracana]|uniref:NB-ARC domain-containing protein n=1 Tax=Eleusine coracana subsp. coracana TaxID=191504 RepID=A0AAV5CAW6_ELECO|nr:hypothetical protein PR202_ga12011 [Eleusine coracana subsp. coracana]
MTRGGGVTAWFGTPSSVVIIRMSLMSSSLGGSGKTTLAKLVYNDSNIIKKHFEVILWVHVSREFVVEKLVEKLYEAIDGNKADHHALQRMSRIISDKLTGKKFLLVLDAVWTEDHLQWEQFMVNLSSGTPGSNILLTTRSRKVAEAVDSTYTCKLPLLSEEDSWNVFLQSFGRAMDALDPEFQQVGTQIVNKCGGVPLAIKVLAGASIKHARISELENLDKLNGELHIISINNVKDPCDAEKVLSSGSFFLPRPAHGDAKPPHLTELKLRRLIDSSFGWDVLWSLTGLQVLEINKCKDLRQLPESMRSLTCLLTLVITNCYNLCVLPEWLGELQSLKSLDITWLPKMSILSQSIQHLTALEILKIIGCDALHWLPEQFGELCSFRMTRDLEDLQDLVDWINGWLENVGGKAISNEKSSNWLKRLKEVAYDAEDLVHEFQMEAEKLDKLFEAIDGDKADHHASQRMSRIISNKLATKKFLLVLDDVWTEDHLQWEQFMVNLMGGAPGSSILLTTRNRKVAEAMDSAYTHDLPLLSEEDSWNVSYKVLEGPWMLWILNSDKWGQIL